MNLQHNSNSNSEQQEPAQESSKASGQRGMTATYSPEDNKLRLRAPERLDAVTYARVKEAGFIWAPKQGFFVAPMWTPGREDLLIELAGEIGDEDTTLVERAEERAERFTDYSEKRADEARSARDGVEAISAGIPFGQPILIGHHSERKARRDAERIENGMRRAVNLWEGSQYWQRRAAGALALAKYKERPDVRHRRVKKLESELRKQERTIKDAQIRRKLWEGCDSVEKAVRVAGFHGVDVWDAERGFRVSVYTLLTEGKMTHTEAAEKSVNAADRTIARAERWANHYRNRIAYERAMLDESGGLPAQKFDIQPGGMVLVGGEWLTVVRVTRKAGEVVSVTTNARFVPRRGVEEIENYRAPSAEDAAKAKAVSKLPPLVNYPGEGFQHMTKAEFAEISEGARFIRAVGASETVGRHRVRFARTSGYQAKGVYLTDAKRVDPPEAGAPTLKDLPKEPAAYVAPLPKQQDEEAQAFEALRKAAKTPVEVVSVPQLFPTPAALAARMVQEAEVSEGDHVLEPSAGTGALLDAIEQERAGFVVAVEVNSQLCQRLRARVGAQSGGALRVHEGDFLQATPEQLGKFSAVIMNPPFANAADIKHVKHAMTFLVPGGRLVAIVAGGPRQAEQLRDLAEQSGGFWEPLPDGTFAEQGTNVRTALVVIRA